MSGSHVQHEIRNNSEYPCGVINKTSFNHDNFYTRNILYHTTKNLSISKLYIIIISIFGQYRIMAKSISFICNRTAIFVRIWHEAANQNSTSRFPHCKYRPGWVLPQKSAIPLANRRKIWYNNLITNPTQRQATKWAKPQSKFKALFPKNSR